MHCFSSLRGKKMSLHGASPTAPSTPSTTITAGLDVIEHNFIWRIRDFSVIAKQDSLLKLQHFLFEVMDGRGHGQVTKWMVYLDVEVMEGEGEDGEDAKWVGIFYTVDKGTLPANVDHLYSEVAFQIKDKEGNSVWDSELDKDDLRKVSEIGEGWGNFEMIGLDQPNFLLPETLEVHISFKLYSPAALSMPTPRVTLEQPLCDDFQTLLAAKARKDLAVLVQDPVGGDVKIMSKDKMEFLMPRGILSARSPVFQAMFRSEMSEATDGVIKLPDITGKSLGVLLHFFYTGELLQDWKEPMVVIELTNAAAKYQLSDLLQFLDMMLGKVCEIENVVTLFGLANQLSLKTAEEELLKFIREKGVNSPESFLQIVRSISAYE